MRAATLVETVYFISGFEKRRGVEAQAPWFVISGTGNLDIPRNVMGYRVVASESVWDEIENFKWIDCPYVVTGRPAATQEEALMLLAELERRERQQRYEEEMAIEELEVETPAWLYESNAEWDDDLDLE